VSRAAFELLSHCITDKMSIEYEDSTCKIDLMLFRQTLANLTRKYNPIYLGRRSGESQCTECTDSTGYVEERLF
jgi:hypothetical protein